MQRRYVSHGQADSLTSWVSVRLTHRAKLGVAAVIRFPVTYLFPFDPGICDSDIPILV